MTSSDRNSGASKRTPSVTDPHFDSPASFPLRRSYIIASTPRSGSTFLSSLLWQTGVLGAPTEYWNCRKRLAPKSIGSRMMERLEAHSRADYLDKLLACRTSKNGVFGIKVQFNDFEETLEFYPEALDRLSPVNYIYIERSDKIAQAVSMVKAMQTGMWASAKGRRPTVADVTYDKDMIARCLEKLEEQRAGWMRWFDANKIEPLQVPYETLAADPPKTVQKILAFVGAENDQPQEIHFRSTERQGDSTNKEWAEKFRQDQKRSPKKGGGTAARERGKKSAQSNRKGAKAPTLHFLDRFDQLRNPDAEARSRAGKRLRLRYEAIIGRNLNIIQSARVLDIQCGSGRWGLAALDAGAKHFVGVESRHKPIETGQAIFEKFGVKARRYEFMHGKIMPTLSSFEAGAFDVILCLEYSTLADLHQLFAYFRRLKPKHVILDLATSNREGTVATFHYAFKYKSHGETRADEQRDGFAALAAAPSNNLIKLLCGYFGFQCEAIDWATIGAADRVGVGDYDTGLRRTYVLERTS
jgi:trehalose 2-sulfotransferase